jgi:UDP-N-acetylglucosamine enolpyruvyl transferase
VAAQSPVANDVAQIADVARIHGFLPYLKAEIERQEAMIDNKVASKMMEGPLDADFAVQMWIEKMVLRRLLRGFDQKVAVGTSLGAQIGPLMTLNRS